MALMAFACACSQAPDSEYEFALFGDSPYRPESVEKVEALIDHVNNMGPWKAIRLRPPWEDSTWRLHNLSADPGEEHDLALEEPELLAQLISAYHDFAEANGGIDEPAGITAYPYKPGHLVDLVP